MMRLNKNAFLSAALICFGALGLTNCTSAPTNTAANNTAANNAAAGNRNAVVTSSSPANTTAPSNTTASTGEKIGIAECDDFIAKYEACVTDKVPEAMRGTFQSSIAQWRSSWKTLANNPQTKGTLADICKKQLETSKQALSAYSCAW